MIVEGGSETSWISLQLKAVKIMRERTLTRVKIKAIDFQGRDNEMREAESE